MQSLFPLAFVPCFDSYLCRVLASGGCVALNAPHEKPVEKIDLHQLCFPTTLAGYDFNHPAPLVLPACSILQVGHLRRLSFRAAI
jgi:hypothetical protein